MNAHKTHNIISCSGGKDSTATLLLALERGAENLQTVFADTGHEHPEVYKYLDYLEARLQISIRRIKPDFSTEILHKRDVVKTKWAKELPIELMADKAGAWKLLHGYVLAGEDKADEITGRKSPFISVRCPDGSVIDVLRPPVEPDDVYAQFKVGVFVWKPAVRGLHKEEAQRRSDEIISSALEVLYPTGNPFLDLCLWKGRFPSTMARFCTEELKRNPIINQVFNPLLEDPETDEVWSWQGIRADESASRSKLPEMDEVGNGQINYRPILTWTAQDVFDFHRKHGVKWNPLYEMGMGRVGCMPCINCRKDELREIAKRFPDEIARVAEWERMVSQSSKRQGSSFFGPSKMPGIDLESVSNEQAMKMLNIDKVIEWSQTGKGGRTFDMLALMEPEVGCSSAYGLCDKQILDSAELILDRGNAA